MGRDVVEYCGLELAIGLLVIGGTTILLSGLELANRDADCMPALNGAAGIAGLEALFCIKLGKDSEDNAKGGTGGRLEGKEVFVALRGLEVVGSKGKRNSGWLEPGKLEVPVGKDGLKEGYCIEGGIASPVGGRSKGCWWI